MAGVTKHIYEHEINDILAMWRQQVNSITFVLPRSYSERDVILLLRRYYPHEWESVEMKYQYYKIKDKCIKKWRGKSRYSMPAPEDLLRKLPSYNKILSVDYQKRYSQTFNEAFREEKENLLQKKTKPRIDKVNKKIERALLKTQQVTPSFLDQLIGFYERKNTTQKDKLYIMRELKKYFSPQIIQFFLKLNDTELNKQLRWEAFYHLQSFNYHPRARRQKYMQVHTSNKIRRKYLKNIYPDERFVIPQCPDELEYRINNGPEQRYKEFDFFISHSSSDSKVVQKLISHQNTQQKNIFCDWINDSDYLKRQLLCRATLSVLEMRMQQSKAVIFVNSECSRSSIWCKYELNYFHSFGRPIYIVDKVDIEDGNFEMRLDDDSWYIDPKFKELVLVGKDEIIGEGY